MGGLAFVPPATFLYIATEIWYGNVIPSCYLVNSSDIKDYIMDKGWMDGFSRIYNTRKPKDEARKLPKSKIERGENTENESERSKKVPDDSSTVRNGMIPHQPILKGEENKVYRNKTIKKNRAHNQAHTKSRNDVMLYELDGIQTCRHIPGDAPKPKKKSIDSSRKLKRTNDTSNVPPISIIKTISRYNIKKLIQLRYRY